VKRQRDELLRDALAHFEVTLRYGQKGTSEQLVIDAICMRLSADIEVLSDLDPTVRTWLFGDRWPLMWEAQSHRPRLPAGRLCDSAPDDRRRRATDRGHDQGSPGLKPTSPQVRLPRSVGVPPTVGVGWVPETDPSQSLQSRADTRPQPGSPALTSPVS
jgi:hypothetical protein